MALKSFVASSETKVRIAQSNLIQFYTEPIIKANYANFGHIPYG